MVCGSCVMMCGESDVEPSAAGNVARKLTEEVLRRDLVGTSFCLVFMSIRRICVLLISLLEVQYKSYQVIFCPITPAENLFLIRVVSLERFDSQVLVPILKTVPKLCCNLFKSLTFQRSSRQSAL